MKILYDVTTATWLLILTLNGAELVEGRYCSEQTAQYRAEELTR